MDRIGYSTLIKGIEREDIQIVRVKHWRSYNSLSVEVSSSTTDKAFHRISQKYNGLLTEYDGETCEVGICRRL